MNCQSTYNVQHRGMCPECPFRPSTLAYGREIARHLERSVWIRLNSNEQYVHFAPTGLPDHLILLGKDGSIIERYETSVKTEP